MAMKVVRGMSRGKEVKKEGGHQGMRRVSGGERASFGISNVDVFLLVVIKLLSS